MEVTIAKIQTYNVVSPLCVFSHSSCICCPVSNCIVWEQEIEIKRGAYGLGAFAVKWIRPGQFIGGTFELLFSHTC